MVESNPFETLRQMAGGYCLSRGLHAVANLAVADHWTSPREPPLNSVPQSAHPDRRQAA